MSQSTRPKKRSRVPREATATQLLVLAGLHELAEKLGKKPWQVSGWELSRYLGYASHVGVIKPLAALERLGLIAPVERMVKVGFDLTAAGRKLL